jgi:hypothetical protein
MPNKNPAAQMEDDSGSDQVTTEAMRRDRLAELIGRLLARVILRRRADDSVASDRGDGHSTGP